MPVGPIRVRLLLCCVLAFRFPGPLERAPTLFPVLSSLGDSWVIGPERPMAALMTLAGRCGRPLAGACPRVVWMHALIAVLYDSSRLP